MAASNYQLRLRVLNWELLQFNSQSSEVVPKLETSPEEKLQIEAIKKLRNNVMLNQQNQKK
jgi:hypothetical protein